jgi:hypothetical protein
VPEKYRIFGTLFTASHKTNQKWNYPLERCLECQSLSGGLKQEQINTKDSLTTIKSKRKDFCPTLKKNSSGVDNWYLDEFFEEFICGR